MRIRLQEVERYMAEDKDDLTLGEWEDPEMTDSFDISIENLFPSPYTEWEYAQDLLNREFFPELVCSE